MGLASFARWSIDHPGKIEHGIMHCLQRRRAFAIKIFAKLDVFQFCSTYQLGCACVGRLAGKDLLHQRIVAAKFFGEIGQRIGQPENFVVIVNRLGGKQTEFQ